MLRRIFGPLVFLMGLALAGWVIYNLFIEPTGSMRGSPWRAVGFAVAFLGVGWKWMRGQQAG